MSGADLTPPRRILSDKRMDALGEAVIALTREIWVLTDRQAVLEAVLSEAGVPVERVDSYQPDAAMAERLAARRQALLDKIVETLSAE